MSSIDLANIELKLYNSFGEHTDVDANIGQFITALEGYADNVNINMFKKEGADFYTISLPGQAEIEIPQGLDSIKDYKIDGQHPKQELIINLNGTVFILYQATLSNDFSFKTYLKLFKHFGNFIYTNLSSVDAYRKKLNDIKRIQNIYENLILESNAAIDILLFEQDDISFQKAKVFMRNEAMKVFFGDHSNPHWDERIFIKSASKLYMEENLAKDKYNRIRQNLIKFNYSYDELVFNNPDGENLYFSTTHQIIHSEDSNLILRSFRDITKNKSLEVENLNRKITLDAVLDSTPDSVYALDKNFKVLAINKKAKEDFLELENLHLKVGSELRNLIKKETLSIWRERYFNRVFKGETVKYIGEANRPDGKLRYVENQYTPVKDKNGEVHACLEISRDISDLYRKEAELQNSESKYIDLIETSITGIVRTDEDRFINFVSKQGAEILGLRPQDMIGKDCLDFIHKDALDEGKSQIKNLFNKKHESNVTLRAKHKSSKKKLFLELKAKYLPGKDDSSGQFLINYFDISDKINTEYELNKTKASFDLLYTNTSNPIFLYDMENDNFKMANGAAVELLGYSEKEFTEMSWRSIVDSSTTKEAKDFNSYIDKQSDIKDYSVLVTKNGSRIFCAVSFLSANIKQTESFVVLNDYTQQIQKNKELEKYIESNLQLENFAYIASHDLKAPLRTVSSFAHLLKENSYDGMDEKGKNFMDIILNNAIHMQQLIDDLLDFSKINTQDTKLRKIDVKSLIQRVLSQIKTTIVESKAEITLGKFPDEISGDESMLIQLFQNLIGNGIKFVNKDQVPKIHISYKSQNEYHEFCVEDNGIGISNKDIDKIFNIFKKLHNQETYPGTGLGLTICKRIAEKHSGKIWIESELGVGSKFYVTLGKRQ